MPAPKPVVPAKGPKAGYAKNRTRLWGNGVVGSQKAGDTKSYTTRKNNGNGTIAVTKVTVANGKTTKARSTVAAPSTKARNTGGAAQATARKMSRPAPLTKAPSRPSIRAVEGPAKPKPTGKPKSKAYVRKAIANLRRGK